MSNQMFARDHVNCLSLTARAIIRGSLLTTCNNLEDLLPRIVDLTTAAVVGTIIGSLSNHHEDGANNVTKFPNFIMKTSGAIFIFVQREMTCSAVMRTTRAYDDKFSMFSCYLQSILTLNN